MTIKSFFEGLLQKIISGGSSEVKSAFKLLYSRNVALKQFSKLNSTVKPAFKHREKFTSDDFKEVMAVLKDGYEQTGKTIDHKKNPIDKTKIEFELDLGKGK